MPFGKICLTLRGQWKRNAADLRKALLSFEVGPKSPKEEKPNEGMIDALLSVFCNCCKDTPCHMHIGQQRGHLFFVFDSV